MKLAINKRITNGPWGGGNQILKLLVDYFVDHGIEVRFDLKDDVDAILMMDSRDSSCCLPLSSIKDYKENHKVKIIHRINDTGIHRENDISRTKIMIEANNLADVTIFISDWVKDYYFDNGIDRNKNIFVIDNGADRNLFNPSSRIRDKNDPIRIVTHHWSDNIAKGYDIYKKVDAFCNNNKSIAKFRFIGRKSCHGYFSDYCDKITEKTYKELPEYLSPMDVYLSASLNEAGGCHIVEGMACGLFPIVRVGGGGTVCYSLGYGTVFNSTQDIIKIILDLYNNSEFYRVLRKNVVDNYIYSSLDMCKRYYDAIIE